MTTIDLRDVVREFLRREEQRAGSIARLAEYCGVTRPALSQTLSGSNNPTLDILVGFCESTKTAPHRMLMALLAIANELETQTSVGVTILPNITYEKLNGRTKTTLDPAMALKYKGQRQRRKKGPEKD